MSRSCDICGKHPMYGNKVSKSFNHTKRTWRPNLLKVKTEIGGTTRTYNVCTRCLRSGFIVKKVTVPKQVTEAATSAN
ncbi:MAG: 50S ribosomal protein L28 [Treponema sp.]|nr:50S ribosomal protein L28 [Treponema sp.]